MISVRVDDTLARRALDELARGVGIERAWRRATKRTAGWAKSLLSRRMSRRTGFLQRVFRAFRVKTKASGDGSVVWFGIKPVKAAYAGRLQQLESGALAGAYFFEGGFLARMPTGHLGIYKRKGRARLPIVEQTIVLAGAKEETDAVAAEAQEEWLRRVKDEIAGEIRRATRGG